MNKKYGPRCGPFVFLETIYVFNDIIFKVQKIIFGGEYEKISRSKQMS